MLRDTNSIEQHILKGIEKSGLASPRVAIIVDPDKSAEYKQANDFTATLRLRGCRVSITPKIPDDSSIICELKIFNYKDIYDIFDEHHGTGLRTVVCGSFKRNFKDIQSAMAKFAELEVRVLSPTEPEIIEEIDDSDHDFAILEGDKEYETAGKRKALHSETYQSILYFLIGSRTPRTSFEVGMAYADGKIPLRQLVKWGFQNDLRWQIEQRHCEKILESHFVWVSCPDGYIGNSTAFELGFAHANKKLILSNTPPSRGIFRLYTYVTKSIEEAVAVEKYKRMKHL